MKYISVSTILDKIWHFDSSKINPFVLLRATTKGDCIHKQLENYINNDFAKFPNCECVEPLSNHNQVPVLILPYLLEMKEKGYLKTEYGIRNSEYGVRGIIDLVIEHYDFENGNKFSIIDWKTNSAPDKKKWRIQVNLYHWLVSGRWNLLEGETLQVIHINNELQENGKPKLNKNGWKIIDFEPLNEMEIEYIMEIIKELQENEL